MKINFFILLVVLFSFSIGSVQGKPPSTPNSDSAVVKVTVLHKVVTKKGEKWIELRVPATAVVAHLLHGDKLAVGPCEPPFC